MCENIFEVLIYITVFMGEAYLTNQAFYILQSPFTNFTELDQ